MTSYTFSMDLFWASQFLFVASNMQNLSKKNKNSYVYANTSHLASDKGNEKIGKIGVGSYTVRILG